MPNSPPIRVLVVDDEPDLCALTKSFLEISPGLEVTTADSVGGALTELASCAYDVIVSDYQMPREDGIQFLKRLRAGGDKIPFILLTGKGREEIVIEALNSGADFYLQKGGNPVAQYRELEHKVREAVRRRRAERSLLENEARLTRAQVIGLSGCWEFHWDVKGGYIWGSEEAFSIFGIPRTSDGIIPQERLEACIVGRDWTTKALVDLIEQGKEYNLEYEILPEDGSPRKFIHSMAELIRDAEGRPLRVEGVIQDITARRDSEMRVRRLNRELLAMKECGRALVKAKTEQELLDEVCRIVCEVAGYRLAWIGMAQANEARSVLPVAWNGFDREYVAQIKATWGEDERGCGPTGMAIKTGRTVFIQDFANDATTGPWREQAMRNGYRSSIGLPLLDSGKAFGAFMLYSDQINGFTADELSLLEEMASDLAFGIVSLRAQAEKVSARKELHDVDARFRALFQATGVPTLVIDMGTHRLMEINPAAASLYGYAQEEVFSVDVRCLFAEAEEALGPLWRQDGFLPLCYQKRKDGSIFPAEITTKIFTIGGRPTMIATSRDISERLQAETALKESEERFQCLADNALEGIAISIEGVVVDMNKALTDMLDYSPQETIGMNLRDFFTADSRPILAEKLRLANTEPYMAKVFRKDGAIRTIMIRGKNIVWKGRPARLGSVRDITEQIAAEELVQETLADLNRAQSIAHVGSWKYDVASDRFLASEESLRIYGFPPGHRPSFPEAAQRVHPEDREMASAALRNAIHTGAPYQIRFRIIRDTGEIRTIASHTKVKFGPDGRTVSVLGTHQDVTDNIEVEEALWEKEKRYRLLVESTNEAIVVVQGGVMRFANPAAIELFGASYGELTSVPFMERIHFDDRAILLDRQQRHAQGEPLPDRYIIRLLTKGDVVKWAEMNSVAIEWEGKPASLSFVSDITERKQAEMTLVSTQARLREAHRMAHFGTWDWRTDDDSIAWSEELYAIFGRDRSDPLPRFKDLHAFYTPDSWGMLDGAVTRAIATGEPFSLELEIVRPDGGRRWTTTAGKVKYDDSGRVVHGTVQDITRRKHAEEELKRTNAYLQNLLDYANAPIIVWDPQLRITIFNHAFERLTKMNADRVLGEHLRILFPEESMEQSLALIQQTLVGQRWEVVEIPIRTEGGAVRTVLWNSATITATGGEIIATIAQGQDITERKLAEEALRQGQETLRLVVSSAPFPLLISDRDGTYIIDANERAIDAFGLTAGVTQMLGDIFSDGSALKAVTEAMATKGFVDEMEVALRNSAAEPRWAVISVRAMSYQGEERLVLATYDITERRQMEKALQIANTKLGILNSITRHDIINQMQALAGYIELCKMKEKDMGQMKYLAKMSKSAENVQKMVAFTKEYQDIGVKAPI